MRRTSYAWLLPVAFLAASWAPQLRARADTKQEFASAEFGLSPDGKLLAYPVPAYDKLGDPITEIWISAPDGSSRKCISALPGAWSVRWRNLSEIVAYRFDTDKIHIIEAADGKRSAVSLTDQYQWAQPAVSPNGRQIAFNAVRKQPRGFGVFLQDMKSTGVRRLNGDVVRSFVDWSPDSRKLIYGVGDYQRSYRLMIVDVETGTAQAVGIDGTGARWSPDGKWIAYTGDVVKGGSWTGGIPTDGRILKMNLATKETTPLTEPGINERDPKTGRWTLCGAFNPVWSPDGRRFAYRRASQTFIKGENQSSEDQIWVMNADGSARHKIWEKASPHAWANDSESLFVKDESGITRIMLGSGLRQQIVSWGIPSAPSLSAGDYVTLSAPGAQIKYARFPPEYARAILAVAGTARNVYIAKFHCDMPAVVQINAAKKTDEGTSLWNDGESELFLTIKLAQDLDPPSQSRVFNIYGLCHEMGHLAMYRRVRHLGLPDGIAEGWADCAGSVVTDEVYARLGSRVWPIPYDYRADGLVRLQQRVAKPGDSIAKAAAAFYAAHERYGAEKVFAAINRAMDSRPNGKDVMPRFVDALVKETSEGARVLFVSDLLRPTVVWKTKQREITDRSLEGLMAAPDATGIVLKCDSGKSAGMRSTAGAGHAVYFKRPPGKWAVDAAELYGSRYGEPSPPKMNFSIFVCDKDFNVIREFEQPYSKLTYGDHPAWNRLALDPIIVPELFYICVFFNPTHNRGFYVHYERKSGTNHSRSALPWTFVADVEYEWMIRVHLRQEH